VARRRRISKQDERLIADSITRVLADRRARAVVLIVLLVSLAAWGGWYAWQHDHAHPSPSAGATTNPAGRVRVATWNLRKFSDREREGQHPPDLVTIARIIKDNAFDVVAIQEVQLGGGGMVQKLRRQLNDPWRVGITEPTGEHLKERYAFLYNADRVELLDTPRIIDGPESSQFDRRPGIASFRSGNFDFTLVTAHLWYGEKANNAKRRQEAAALARFARDLAARGPEHDVIVLGDFNEMRADGNLRPYFEAQGWLRIAPGLVGGVRDTTNLGSTETFDNILIDPRYTREYANDSGVVKFDELLMGNDDKRAANEVSDHRPVWADFDTTLPDDD
jgi:endonuclease/exonuclease/phosphatase family metal-dependent hydrolase